ncbi:phage-related baseplate assembly protein [Trabulsiella guamensis ATCC 49490]|uniref:Phage-related baseplate assembly protein n=1 Tax=Trabulsiella guamensis ATCC 49490 TaxID=1005994 RepID=A0A085AFN5_9ENTR|nr:baseplate J/gp47 family protein [Trabulsiella guamensis]KFC09030.1 phage-related baseplate assembly protein [Trabulsiella guamensis ATCC 49490]
MFNPLTDRLPVPDALVVTGATARLPELKQALIDEVTRLRPADAAGVVATLENNAEMLTVLLQAMSQVITTRERRANWQMLQMLLLWAEGSNLDARAADAGIKRQVITAGDPDAIPPISPEMESDDDLRFRSLLAPYGFATTGSRTAYRFHAMTLGEKPHVTIDSEEAGVVTLTYRFPDSTQAAKVRDASARVLEPGTGKVGIWILSREADNGVPGTELVAAAQQYLTRDDVALETDIITVYPGQPLEYTVHATLHGKNTPDGLIDAEAIRDALDVYTRNAMRLEGRIDISMLYYLLQKPQTVTSVDLHEPQVSVVADHTQAPYCTGIELEVIYDL